MKRFTNARICTMVDNTPIFHGEILTDQDQIYYVGPQKEWDMEFEEDLDCHGNLLMPGFKNAHTHSAMTFGRSYADDLPLNQWLFHKIFPLEAHLTPEDQFYLSQIAILEYLTGGITANFDMYLDTEPHIQASELLGFRTVICGSMNDFGGTVEEMEQDYDAYHHKSDYISYEMGFHCETTTNEQRLKEIAELAHQKKARVFTHIAEAKEDVESCQERNGCSPFVYLDSLGIFDYGGGGFHGVWLDDTDRKICKEKEITIITNPCANLKLASGIPDVLSLYEKGVNLAIGTDGPAGNNGLDFFKEMYLTATLPKVFHMDAAAMDASEVLKMATVGGARAMGLNHCDTLAEGKAADFIEIDLMQPNMQPIHDLKKNIVYSGSKENVKMTVIGGKILYQDHEFHLPISVEELYRKCEEITKRIISSV